MSCKFFGVKSDFGYSISWMIKKESEFFIVPEGVKWPLHLSLHNPISADSKNGHFRIAKETIKQNPGLGQVKLPEWKVDITVQTFLLGRIAFDGTLFRSPSCTAEIHKDTCNHNNILWFTDIRKESDSIILVSIYVSDIKEIKFDPIPDGYYCERLDNKFIHFLLSDISQQKLADSFIHKKIIELNNESRTMSDSAGQPAVPYIASIEAYEDMVPILLFGLHNKQNFKKECNQQNKIC